ncbi:hypothetical protein psal_cds_255 [Pandoravirus salinus]|uniref:Ankyrin repeat domain containing protein n=1 Tax=Pandoravirus salinus TaxID=1349410 RepID=S4VWJ8_9VIRU|nr:hypothetical protein psal_cds_255 [Pandoravirus salinus]AGO83816.1 hypothetical protein psal_cds_255 [Pandoravirus salinus]
MQPTTIETLPTEILALVLNAHLAKPWRPLAARVSHAWRGIITLDVEAALQRVARRHGKADASEVYMYTARRANPLIIGKPTLAAAAAGSHLDLLRWLLKHPRVRLCGSIVRAAAYAGAIDAIAFFLKRKPSLVRAAARYAAARGGQKALLEWFLARDLGHHAPSDSDHDGDGDDNGNDPRGAIAVDDGGHDDDEGDGSDDSSDDSCCDDVVWTGNPTDNHMCDVDDAEEFFDRDEMWPTWHADGGGMHSSACDQSGSAITDETGTDEVEDWWGPNMCANAARGGHLDLLKWLRGPDVRCRWDAWTAAAAAAGGHVAVLSWALTECAPPCRLSQWRTGCADADYSCEAIGWAARAPRNNVEALAVILSTGYAPTFGDLKEVLLFGRTDMADAILKAHPSLWQPDTVPWWSHGRDERRPVKAAGALTLLWAIEQLDRQPATWSDTVEIALTYAAIVHDDCADAIDALRARGRCRLGDLITTDQARSVHPWADVAAVVRTGKRVAH